MKKWYTSKTLWVNVVAILAGFLGKDVINSEAQIGILAVINMILRAVTKTGIEA